MPTAAARFFVWLPYMNPVPWTGSGTTKCKPTGQVSAAQAVTLAARLRKLSLTGNGTFSAGSPWSQSYLNYALSQASWNELRRT